MDPATGGAASLRQDEAVTRAALLRVESYDVHLTVTADDTFRSRTVTRFACTEPGAGTFAELSDPLAVTATLNGRPVPADAMVRGRIRLDDLASSNELVVEATLPCVTDGEGLHRYVDPADGATYVAAYCGMDVARRVFACFDQPDLKAALTLTVDAPPEWTVLGNGRLVEQDGRARRFATTPPVPPYLFVMCAGPWRSVTWQHRGLPFGWHARASQAADLAAAAGELRRITEACFDHYTATFAEPFVFDSYDQVFAPGLNWGAMETAGCVTFRDELLHPAPPSDLDRLLRAMVVAHEMAHMWFGDLVTMRWWEDAWLSESFADYMGFEVATAVAGLGDAWLLQTLAQKRRAYVADRRRSTHPVAPGAGAVVDAETALTIFDDISYAKGNSLIRQLVTWLGEADFRAGVDDYLARHRFGNAELDDFLAALDGATARDVRRWADLWLRTTGFDTLRVTRADDELPVLSRDGIRPHRTSVAAYRLDGGRLTCADTRMVDVADHPARLDGWEGLLVLPNSGDHTFARVRTDEASWAGLVDHLDQVPSTGERAMVWAIALDRLHLGELAPAELDALLVRQLGVEPDPTVWEGVSVVLLDQLLARSVPTSALAATRAAVAAAAGAALNRSPALALPASRALAACTTDATLLESWLADSRTTHGLSVDADLRWRALARLAELGATDRDRIDAEERAHPDTTAEQGAARARAALPTPEAKAAAWQAMAAPEVSNRIFEASAEGFWVPDQAALVADHVPRYLAEAPAWAHRRGQGFQAVVGQAFPRHAVDEETRAALAAALEGRLPAMLRREWDDALDDLDVDLAVRRARSAG